jgi:hypothetical protein
MEFIGQFISQYYDLELPISEAITCYFLMLVIVYTLLAVFKKNN